MPKYILKRFFISLGTLLILVTAVFFLVRALPGDPFINDKLTPEIRQNMLHYYGFDKPLYKQYFRYIGNLLRGDLGISLHYNNVPITRLISDSFPYSADLGLRALLLAIVAGIGLGIISALNRGRWLDYLCIFIAILGVSLPDFITGYILQFIFGIKLKLFPVAMWRGLKYTILPTLALSFYGSSRPCVGKIS